MPACSLSASGDTQSSITVRFPGETGSDGIQRVIGDITKGVPEDFAFDLWSAVHDEDTVYLMLKQRPPVEGWRNTSRWTSRPAGSLTVYPGRSGLCGRAALKLLTVTKVTACQELKMVYAWSDLNYGWQYIDLSTTSPYGSRIRPEEERGVIAKFSDRRTDIDDSIAVAKIRVRGGG